MKIIQSGTKYSIFDSSIQTHDRLPAGTYAVVFNQGEGFFLIRHADIAVEEKTYGVHTQKVGKVMSAFSKSARSLGVILSGDKGIGKSLFAKCLCVEAMKSGLAVILVDSCIPGIASFIESIEQECIVLFDEFDKTFRSSRERDDQAGLLSLFDGTAGGKKLFVVTCNELYGLNDYIVNRPGRFHYHFRFDYPTPADIREYLTDQVLPEYHGEIEKVVSFAQKIRINYDCLRSIAFELNLGSDFSAAIADLNILNVEPEEYNLVLHFEGGQTLHEYGLRVNLFDGSRTFNWTTMYNDNGVDVAELRFDKVTMTYDISRNMPVIPAHGLKLDFSGYDECSASDPYRDLKPAYLTFSRCLPKSLHFAV